MSSQEATKQTTPGQLWLALPIDRQNTYLEGLIEGLNQGLRQCASETVFSLNTRLSKDMTAENQLAVDSLTQQMRTWSKPSIYKFKFSKPLNHYSDALCKFYSDYPQYEHLTPAYLIVFMDDQHGMGPAELFSLHEHSLHGFKR